MRTKQSAAVIRGEWAIVIPAGLPVRKTAAGDYEVCSLHRIANVPAEVIEAWQEDGIILRPDQVEVGHPLPGKITKPGWVIISMVVVSFFCPPLLVLTIPAIWILYQRIKKRDLEEWGPEDDKDE